MNGRISVGKYIQKALQRHVDDLKKVKQSDFPFFFSKDHAALAIDAAEVQTYSLGEKAGQPFVLEPWQACILYLAYGWRRKSNQLRRFRKAYVKVPRGNGKTEFLSTVGNIGFFFETVKDPQILWVSNTVTQSKIGFARQKEMARALMETDATFHEMYGVRAQRIYEKMGNGYVGFLSSRPQDGTSPSYGLVDEYHEFPDDARIHSLESGMIKRANPFLWIITTAGVNQLSPCAAFEKSCKAMLDGSVVNDQLLAFCYDIDETDNWQDPKVWQKANPNWGVSVDPEIFRSEYEKALAEGFVKEANFRTKNLNVWVSSKASWLRDEIFRAANEPFDVEAMDGRRCFGGLDLSLSDDMSALALLFPPNEEGEPFKVVMRYWCTEETAYRRNQHDGIPYLQWMADGRLDVCEGNKIDFEQIRGDLRALKIKYDWHSCAIDPYRKLVVTEELNREFGKSRTQTKEFFEGFAQNPRMFTAPLTELAQAIKGREVTHGGNPILEWNNRNVTLYTDGNGNFKMDKGKSSDKIDGMVALAMAWGQWMTYKSSLITPYSPVGVYFL